MPSKLKTAAAIAGSVAAMAAIALPAATASAATVSHAAPAVRTAALPVITITMTGKKISVGGALQSGGAQIVSKVSGEAQASPVLVRLDPGVTVQQFISMLPKIAADPNNIDGVGSIVFSPEADKGTSSVQASLAAGQYVALDLSPKQPVLTTFVISKAASPAPLPKPAATVASIEFAFQSPARLHEGSLVRFANDGFLVHMIVAAQAKNAADARKIAQLLKAGKDGQVQKLAIGFATYFNALSHGAFDQQVLTSKPGFWVLACFMDTQDHREHTKLGMEKIIQIVK
jgi:hypothetical protein